MKRIMIFILALLICASTAYGIPISATRDVRVTIGAYTGPVGGTAIDDNIKAHLDAIHSKIGGTGTGSNWYVDSAIAGTTGVDWSTAVGTLNAAVALCSSNNGDVIHIAAGHNENWTGVDSADLDVAGITLLGYGEGLDRPCFDFDDAAAEMVFGEPDIRIYNLAFQPGYNQVVHAIEIEADADGAIIDNCVFYPGEAESTDEFLDAIQLTAAADDVLISNCIAIETTAGAKNFVDLSVGIVDNVRIINNYIHGPYSEGCIYSDKVLTFAYTKGNVCTNTATGVGAIVFSTTATGAIYNNYASCDDPTKCIDPGSMESAGNYEADYGAAEDAEAGPAWATGKATASTANYPDNIEPDSLFAMLMCAGTTATATTYDNTLHSLEAIAEYITAGTGVTTAIEADFLHMLMSATVADEIVDSSFLADLTTVGSDWSDYSATTMSLEALNIDLDAILLDTGTNIPATITTAQNDLDIITDSDGVIVGAAALALIEAEATDAIQAATALLDHLVAVADADDVVDDAIVAHLASKSATANWSSFDNETDSLEAISDKVTGLLGIGFRGTATNNAVTTTVVSADLAGFGDDYFNTGWSLIVIKDYAGAAADPEGRIVDITDYATATGTFTVLTTTTAVTTGDEVYIRRTEDLELDVPTTLGASGNVWYVDSGASTGDSTGKTWENAFDTVALAIAGATADNGDVIYLAAGHAESLTGILALNIDGMSIIGLGEGDLQPTIAITTGTTTDIEVTGADLLLQNIKIESNLPDIDRGLHLSATSDGARIKNCNFTSSNQGTNEFEIAIDIVAAADDIIIEGCNFLNVGGAGTHAIKATGAVDNLQIKNNWIFGTYTVASIWSDQSCTNILVKDNVVTQLTAGQMAIELTAATGNAVNNSLSADAYLTMYDFGGMLCMGNVGVTLVDRSEKTIPVFPTKIDSEHGTGQVFYVDSGAGASGDGKSWGRAFQTMDAAIAVCVDDRGDTIYVAQGHIEDEATAASIFTMDCEGVSVIGVSNRAASGVLDTGAVTGTDHQMPLFSLRHASATVSVTQANCLLKGLRFEADIADVAIGITVSNAGDGLTIDNCVFRDGAVGEELVIGVQFAADADNITVKNNSFSTVPAGGCASAIRMAGGCDNSYLYNNHIYGTYSVACLDASTAASINLQITDNVFAAVGTTKTTMNAATTGIISGNTGMLDSPLVAGKTYSLTNTLEEGDEDIFQVAGGSIMITNFMGLITETIGAGAESVSIIYDGVDDFTFSTSVNTTGWVRGSRIVFSTAQPAVLSQLALVAAGSGNTQLSWFCPLGMIEVVDAEDNAQGGIVAWSMTFIPLTEGVIVTVE